MLPKIPSRPGVASGYQAQATVDGFRPVRSAQWGSVHNSPTGHHRHNSCDTRWKGQLGPQFGTTAPGQGPEPFWTSDIYTGRAADRDTFSYFVFISFEPNRRHVNPHLTLTTMSPVAPLESPFPHRVIVEDFSDKESVSPVNRATPARLNIVFLLAAPCPSSPFCAGWTPNPPCLLSRPPTSTPCLSMPSQAHRRGHARAQAAPKVPRAQNRTRTNQSPNRATGRRGSGRAPAGRTRC